MVSFRRHNREYLQHKLKRLQDLQTEIYRQLQLLIPDEIVHYDSFLSRVHGSPLLRMDVLERHPYTHFVRLTYQFEKMEPPEVAPDAHIRVYNDARMAEVTSFDPVQGFTRQGLELLTKKAPGLSEANQAGFSDSSLRRPTSVSSSYPPLQILQSSWRQNRALDKWLSYLLHQGHSLTSMQAASNKISGNRAKPLKQTVHSI